jgi:hypothetical protein
MSRGIPEHAVRDSLDSHPDRRPRSRVSKSYTRHTLTTVETRDSSPRGRRLVTSETAPPTTSPTHSDTNMLDTLQRSQTYDGGHRQKVANFLTKASNYMGTAAPSRDSEFKFGKAKEYPTTPGEELVNRELRETETRFNQRREAENQRREAEQEAINALHRQRSRAPSTASRAVDADDGGTITPRPYSIRRRRSSSPPSPDRSIRGRRPRSGTMSSEHRPSAEGGHAGPSSAPQRRATLEVPQTESPGVFRRISTAEPAVSTDEDEADLNPASPTIVISKDSSSP